MDETQKSNFSSFFSPPSDFQGGCEGGVDAEAAVTACLDCYSQMLQKMHRAWSDVPLLRVFYRADLCSYDAVLKGEWAVGFMAVSASLQDCTKLKGGPASDGLDLHVAVFCLGNVDVLNSNSDLKTLLYKDCSIEEKRAF